MTRRAPRTVVVTVVAGRHDHLRRQLVGLRRSDAAPDHHIVVSMGDPDVEEIAQGAERTVVTLDTPYIDAPSAGQRPRLPIARARNIGAQMAGDLGADLIVFLDVDCIPAPQLIDRYVAAALPSDATLASDATPSSGALASDPALWCGPVTYLPPGALDAMDDDGTGVDLAALTSPHPARPDPPDGQVVSGDNHDLFWSLSFAVSPETFERLGGFCEQYAGYGCEDTDLASVARSIGVPLRWVGGAHAYHQHHPVSLPPVEHLDDIVINAQIFHRRHGRWPMAGWLAEFESKGLIRRLPGGIIEISDQNLE